MFLHVIPNELINTFLDMAYTLIASDGVATEDEERVFGLYATEMNVEKIPKCNVVDYDEVLPKFELLENVKKKEIYFELLSLAYADSKFAEEEHKLLNKVAVAFNIADKEQKQMGEVAYNLLKEYEKLGEILRG